MRKVSNTELRQAAKTRRSAFDTVLVERVLLVSLLAADSRRIGNGAVQDKFSGSSRKRSIVMTQTNGKTTRAGPLQADREAFQVASADTMKAIVYTKYGSPDVLQLKEVAKPTPKDNEVLVKVHAASVNAGDWHLLRAKPFLMRLMGYGLLKPKYRILGSDIAGRVAVVGRNVTQFQAGDEVFGNTVKYGFGGFAEYVSVPEDALVLKPTNISFAEAAAVPQAALVALQGLRNKGQIKPGQKILIYGASGGIGTFAV